eukprot:13986472-Heterocapsa_arctica.AAC.1
MSRRPRRTTRQKKSLSLNGSPKRSPPLRFRPAGASSVRGTRKTQMDQYGPQCALSWNNTFSSSMLSWSSFRRGTSDNDVQNVTE